MNELMALILERSSETHTLWTMFITVVIGILGYISATASTSSSILVRTLLIIGFSAFAFVNCKNLRDVHFHKDQLIEVARLNLGNNPTLGKSQNQVIGTQHWQSILTRLSDGSKHLIKFHVFIDAIVVLMIWSMPGALLSLRPFHRFKHKALRPKGSRLLPAVVSWDQLNQEWRLASDYEIKSKNIQIRIPKGFTFDLASIPRLLWPIIGPMELSVVAPLAHDYIYFHGGKIPEEQLLTSGQHKPISRKEADEIFFDLMEQEGVSWIRKTLAFYAVHFLGDRFWRNPASDQ